MVLGTLVGLACLAFPSLAQESGQVIVKIEKNENGRITAIDKTFDSVEELLDDDEFRELMGDNFVTFIKRKKRMEALKEDSLRPKSFYFFNDDETTGEINRQVGVMTQMLDDDGFAFHRGGPGKFRFSMDMDEEPKGRNFANIIFSEPSKDEFGELNKIGKNEQAKFQNLSLKSGKWGNILLSFDPPKDGSIAVSLYDSNNKAIYSSYFEQLSIPVFEEEISMARRPSGDYLLELKSGNKRWVKKVVKE